MNNLLKSEAIKRGDRLQIIASHRVQDLENDIKRFAQSEELNSFQKWIIDDLYEYSVPSLDFSVQSIILMAIAHPFYADVIFVRGGKEYQGKSLVRPYFEEADQYLKPFLKQHGYHAQRNNSLPLKRLGVQSGLSEYGRNNITYVDGLGSNFSLAAYFSDVPCEEDEWRNAVTAEMCHSCSICIDNCPTGAIRKDRFLIDNQRCLSAINETPGDFPEWLPSSVHHTCYDCLRCQEKCPMNIGHTDKMTECIVFTEHETEMMLQGTPVEHLPEDTKRKIFTLGMSEWYEAIPRNIKALMNI